MKTDVPSLHSRILLSKLTFPPSGIRIVPLECRPCGAQVKTTNPDPERWRDTDDSDKGESRSIFFWTFSSANTERAHRQISMCLSSKLELKRQSFKAMLDQESVSEKCRKQFFNSMVLHKQLQTAGMPRISCPGRNSTIGLLMDPAAERKQRAHAAGHFSTNWPIPAYRFCHSAIFHPKTP